MLVQIAHQIIKPAQSLLIPTLDKSLKQDPVTSSVLGDFTVGLALGSSVEVATLFSEVPCV